MPLRDSQGRFARSDCNCRERWYWVYFWYYSEIIAKYAQLTDGQLAARFDAYKEACIALGANLCPACGYDGRGNRGFVPDVATWGPIPPSPNQPNPPYWEGVIEDSKPQFFQS